MDIAKGIIGNALTSAATDHIVAVSNDIYDEELQEYQSELNKKIGKNDSYVRIFDVNDTNIKDCSNIINYCNELASKNIKVIDNVFIRYKRTIIPATAYDNANTNSNESLHLGFGVYRNPNTNSITFLSGSIQTNGNSSIYDTYISNGSISSGSIDETKLSNDVIEKFNKLGKYKIFSINYKDTDFNELWDYIDENPNELHNILVFIKDIINQHQVIVTLCTKNSTNITTNNTVMTNFDDINKSNLVYFTISRTKCAIHISTLSNECIKDNSIVEGKLNDTIKTKLNQIKIFSINSKSTDNTTFINEVNAYIAENEENINKIIVFFDDFYDNSTGSKQLHTIKLATETTIELNPQFYYSTSQEAIGAEKYIITETAINRITVPLHGDYIKNNTIPGSKLTNNTVTAAHIGFHTIQGQNIGKNQIKKENLNTEVLNELEQLKVFYINIKDTDNTEVINNIIDYVELDENNINKVLLIIKDTTYEQDNALNVNTIHNIDKENKLIKTNDIIYSNHNDHVCDIIHYVISPTRTDRLTGQLLGGNIKNIPSTSIKAKAITRSKLSDDIVASLDKIDYTIYDVTPDSNNTEFINFIKANKINEEVLKKVIIRFKNNSKTDSSGEGYTDVYPEVQLLSIYAVQEESDSIWVITNSYYDKTDFKIKNIEIYNSVCYIRENSIDGNNVLSNSLPASAIKERTITYNQIKQKAIGWDELNNDAVTTRAIMGKAVTKVKLSDDVVSAIYHDYNIINIDYNATDFTDLFTYLETDENKFHKTILIIENSAPNTHVAVVGLCKKTSDTITTTHTIMSSLGNINVNIFNYFIITKTKCTKYNSTIGEQSISNGSVSTIKLTDTIKNKLNSIPTNVSELNNDSNYITNTEANTLISTEISKILDNAPEDFDTLKEIADWIQNHPGDSSEMNAQISANKTNIQNNKTSIDRINVEINALKEDTQDATIDEVTEILNSL